MITGKTIAITRSKEDSKEFIDLAAKENAIPMPIPTIELISKGDKIVDEFLSDIEEFNPDYSVFMSSKAVKLLFDVAKNTGKYQQLQLAVANTMVMAVGPKTKEALEKEGVKVSYMPTKYSSVGVGELFTRLNAEGKKVIVPRSGASTEFLAKLLQKIGLVVKENYLYDVKAYSDTTQWKEFKEAFS
ncbi:MAG: uroporphyrinogen-III synthase, partial [Candidatus Nitrosotenuis sp.]